jgi:5-methylcytosine-specific restriction endonuclease McrA
MTVARITRRLVCKITKPDEEMTPRERKTEWQRQSRAKFAAKHGYSTTANYGAGGNREAVLERDNYSCVRCGMTDAEHKAKWDRPITIDHKSKDRSDNSMDNLQALCLTCHGNKDLIAPLRAQKIPMYKAEILTRRAAGEPYQRIANDLGFSIGGIYKWCKKWEELKA